jgi:hypothetical protein
VCAAWKGFVMLYGVISSKTELCYEKLRILYKFISCILKDIV